MYIYVRKCQSHLRNLNAILASTDIDPWLAAGERPGEADDQDDERTETEEDDSD